MANKTLKNIVITTIANLSTIISGILIGFLIPKIMGVDAYGYYKTFTLYMTYVGLFHFGFSDGIYLKYTGYEYENLNKEKFRSYFRLLIFSQLIIVIILLLTSTITINTNYFYILIFVSANCLISNIIFYFQFISQMTSRFKKFANVTTLKSIMTIILVLGLFVLFKLNVVSTIPYLIFIGCVTLIDVVIALIYIFSYKDIVFGKGIKLRTIKDEIKGLYKTGFVLMISNFFVSLILIIDRQFVQILFDNMTYARYAFAYNMLGLVTTALSSLSAIVFPILKKYNQQELEENYSVISSGVIIFVSLAISSFFPLTLIVNSFLLNYTVSLNYFNIIFPSLIFSTQIGVVFFNYYKISNSIKKYFFNVFLVFLASFTTNLVAYLIFKTPTAISIASIFSVAFWYILCLPFLVKNYKIKWKKDLLFILIIIAGFYAITNLVSNIFWGFVIYCSLWIVGVLIFYFKQARQVIGGIKNKFCVKKNETKQ